MKSTRRNLLFTGVFSILLLPNLSAQTLTITGTVSVNQTKNVTSGTFTDSTAFQIQNTGTANIKFFMASTANAKNASSELTVLAGSQVTATVADLGGMTAGTYVNVRNNDNRVNVSGAYIVKMSGNKQTVTYDTYTQTFYNFDTTINPMLIPAQEFLMLTPTERKDQHKEYLTFDNNYVHQIYHILNTEYLPWMKMPVKTVIGLNGVRSYDENNNIVADQPTSQTSTELQAAMINQIVLNGVFDVPKFETISQEKINALTQNGFSVNKTPEGDVHIKKDNLEHIINPIRLYAAKIEYNALNTEIYRNEKTYYHNDGRLIVPNDEVEVYSKQTSNGICYQKIIYTSYTNFKREGPDFHNPVIENAANLDQLFGEGIKAYPNPASETVFVDLPPATNNSNQFVNVTLENSSRKVQKLLQHQNSGTTVSFNITSLQPGVYTVKVTWGSEVKTLQIVKI